MKYIFVSGAPGSKWSSVVKNIYYSADVDSTDYSEARTYHHDATGTMELLHMGVYWGPAMEFGNNFEHLDQYTREQNEVEFDAPFCGTGVRIIKSHVFGYHIDYIKRTWPDCPIVLIDRSDDACLGWWVKCGEFKITYPLYRDYSEKWPNASAGKMKEIVVRPVNGLPQLWKPTDSWPGSWVFKFQQQNTIKTMLHQI